MQRKNTVEIATTALTVLEIPVLLYHDVTDEVTDVNVTSPETFSIQIRSLHKTHTFVTLQMAFEAFNKGMPLPQNALLLTFDDGYIGVRQFAFPLLQDLSIPFVLFPPTDYIGKHNDWNKRCSYWTRHMNETEIIGMFPLCSLGSHSLSHHNMLKLSEHECQVEANLSRRKLEELFGVAVNSYAYPYGASNETIERIIARNYKLAFSVGDGDSNWGASPHRIRRLEPKQWHSPIDLERMISAYSV